MPLAPPVAEMRWNVRPLAPIVVLATLSAGPAGAVVAPIVFVPVMFSVPLFVAVNVDFAPFNVRPPENVNTDVPLPFRMMPVPLLSVIGPLNVTAPLVRF